MSLSLYVAFPAEESPFVNPTIPATVTHATTGYVAKPSDVLIPVDVSGGVVTIKFEPAPALAARHTVKNFAGDAAIAPITVDGNGNNVEDPNNTQSYNATGQIRVQGDAVTWIYDGTQWEIVS